MQVKVIYTQGAGLCPVCTSMSTFFDFKHCQFDPKRGVEKKCHNLVHGRLVIILAEIRRVI